VHVRILTGARSKSVEGAARNNIRAAMKKLAKADL
jgi:hypothetical protein